MPRTVTEIIDATIREGYEATPEEIALVIGTLTPNEEKWRDRHGMLKDEGYDLRPRLKPGWKPSWLESGADPLKCEDGDMLPVGFPQTISTRRFDKSIASSHACRCHP